MNYKLKDFGLNSKDQELVTWYDRWRNNHACRDKTLHMMCYNQDQIDHARRELIALFPMEMTKIGQSYSSDQVWSVYHGIDHGVWTTQGKMSDRNIMMYEARNFTEFFEEVKEEWVFTNSETAAVFNKFLHEDFNHRRYEIICGDADRTIHVLNLMLKAYPDSITAYKDDQIRRLFESIWAVACPRWYSDEGKRYIAIVSTTGNLKSIQFNDIFMKVPICSAGIPLSNLNITESYNGKQIEHVISVPLRIQPIIHSQKQIPHVITQEAPGWSRSERIVTAQCQGRSIAITSGPERYPAPADHSKKAAK